MSTKEWALQENRNGQLRVLIGQIAVILSKL